MKGKQAVHVHLNTFVTRVEKDQVFLKEEGKEYSIKHGTLVWCAGIKPHQFIQDFEFPMNERGRVWVPRGRQEGRRPGQGQRRSSRLVQVAFQCGRRPPPYAFVGATCVHIDGASV